jgi:hypothetical protein
MMPTTRMSCTVDGCDWHHDDPGPGPVEEWPQVPASGVDDYIRQVSKLHYAGIEAVLAEHLATHEPIEYLRTIQRLNSDQLQLRAVAEAARALCYVYEPEDSHTEHNVRIGMEAVRDALAALDGEQS